MQELSAPAPAQAAAVPPGRPSRPATLSCVIPCFNEARNLALLLPRLREVLPECADAWEVVLVDDGSTDATALLCQTWAAEPGFRALLLSRNFGKEAALTAGLAAAAGDVVVMMDADLQHPPELLRTFVEHWQRGAQVVYAVREDRRDEAAFKRVGTRWFYRLINAAARFELPPGAGDFRLMDRPVVEALLSLPERNRFMKGLYAWVGFPSVAVPYVPASRAHGHTHFGALRLIRFSLDGLTAFTTWPLRTVSALGAIMAVVSILYGFYEVVAYFLYGNEVSGWATIVVGLMFLSGMQMISLGIVGEYVGRIFEEVKGRPLYVVRHQAGQGLPPRLR